jgi:serine/threonine protein kinase
MAPEIVSKKEFAGPPADMWALGVLLYALLCGCFPFRGANDKELYRKIMKGQYFISDNVSLRAKCLLSTLLQVDTNLRPNPQEILEN